MDTRLNSRLREGRRITRQNLADYQIDDFEDAYLANFPAIEILETDLTAAEYESVANHLIGLMTAGRMLEAARAMAVLAYNTLMDFADHTKPLFVKYTADLTRERWLAISGQTSVNLADLARRAPVGCYWPTLNLIDPDASDYERKSSIGVWAFRHLRALRQNSGLELMNHFRYANVPVDQNSFTEFYQFRSTYEFPLLDRSVYEAFLETCMSKKPGEMLFLFYLGAIMLETHQRAQSHSSKHQLERRKQLLARFVFGPKGHGLREGGLRLWLHCRDAAGELQIPVAQLFDDLEEVLESLPSWACYARDQLSAVSLLRQFQAKFIRGSSGSRYFMYGPVLDESCFYWLDVGRNKALVYALSKLKPSGLYKDLWMEFECRLWGRYIAERIREKYQLEQLILAQDEEINREAVGTIFYSAGQRSSAA